MATTEFIAAIELGSSKITGIAGKKGNDGSMQVLAYATEDSSSFIRKGVIYNLDKTAQSLTYIISQLEDQLKRTIAKVYVGIGGQSLHTVKNAVIRNLDEEIIISQEFVDAICDENLDFALTNMEILDVIPQEYKIGNNLQVDPVGVASNHVMGNFLNIVARASLKKKLESTFEQAKIKIADYFIAPLITAKSVLTETECRLGCVLVDFGADTTTVSVYKNNILRFLAVVPLGGNNITRDITSLKVEESEAEQLKLTLGNVMYQEGDNEDPAMHLLEDGVRKIEIALLNSVIEARAEEIIMNIWNLVQQTGYEENLLAGFIITGGGANLKNIDALMRKKTKIEKVRFARTTSQAVTIDEELLKKDGTQNTIFGLLLTGKENCCSTEKVAQKPAPQPQPVEPVDLFNEDEALKEQEEIAKEEAKKRKEQEERIRKEKIRKEEERKKKTGPNWIEKTIGKFTQQIFSDDDLK